MLWSYINALSVSTLWLMKMVVVHCNCGLKVLQTQFKDLPISYCTFKIYMSFDIVIVVMVSEFVSLTTL